MDTMQQQLVAQLGIISAAVQDGAKLHIDAARQFAALKHRLDAASQTMADLCGHAPTRNPAGASSANPADGSSRAKGEDVAAHGSGGILGGDGASGCGDVGGGRKHPQSAGEPSSKHQPKMSFPRFDGDQPRIWKDKCLDYFRLFNVHPFLWLVSCTLHMDGNAALWLKAYRLCHEISTWQWRKSSARMVIAST
jgi:hypothetical protein